MGNYIDKMDWRCQCGHARLLHGHTFSRVDDGQPMPEYRPDKECDEGCDCVLFTPSDFKYDTFRSSDTLAGLVRAAQTPSGVPVTFIVDGVQLSIMKNSRDFKDFDGLSQDILVNLEIPEAVTYQWFEGSGFQQL